MDRSPLVRFCGAMLLALLVILRLSPAAFAQEVNEDFIVHHLGPAAEQMQWSGIDGSPDSAPRIIEIAQQWGIGPAFWVSPDEARMLVQAEREDRPERSRYASMQTPNGHPSQVLLARFGIVRVALTCGQAQDKARTAQRLADTLSRVSQLNGAGTGLVGAISQGATRFVAPMAFATIVTSFAATWASQLATAYRNAPCLAGGELWRFRPNVLKTSFSLDPSRIPLSSRGRHGSSCAAWRTGATSAKRDRVYRCSSRPDSGFSRWS